MNLQDVLIMFTLDSILAKLSSDVNLNDGMKPSIHTWKLLNSEYGNTYWGNSISIFYSIFIWALLLLEYDFLLNSAEAKIEGDAL